MRLAIVLRSFGTAPWPLLFATAIIGFALSSRQLREATLADICSTDSAITRNFAALTTPGAVAGWAEMVVAMMPPLLAMPLVYVWNATMTKRRPRAALLFVGGYFAVWMAAGPLLLGLALLLNLAARDAAFGLAFALAVTWSASPWQRAVLNRSHRLPRLRLFGWAGDRDRFAYGVTHAAYCVASCWAWMLVPLVAGDWHLPVMLVAGLIVLAERLSAPRRPAWRWPVPVSFAWKRHG
jgi:predicted metal-binding membrane protein